MSLVLSARSAPVKAFWESVIKTIRRGMITGKLNIAMSVLLLPAFALMPDTIVKTEAKLMLPNKTAIVYKKGSPTGLLKVILYAIYAMTDKSSIIKVL